MTIEFYEADDGWRWRISARNGDILADSGQGYSRRIDALKGASKVTGLSTLAQSAPQRGGFAVRIGR